MKALAGAIIELLDWQSRQLQLKEDKKTDAYRKRYRDKVIENKRLL